VQTTGNGVCSECLRRKKNTKKVKAFCALVHTTKNYVWLLLQRKRLDSVVAGLCLEEPCHHTCDQCGVRSLTGTNLVKRSQSSPTLYLKKGVSQFELAKHCHAVRKVLEASRTSHDNDITTPPLENTIQAAGSCII